MPEHPSPSTASAAEKAGQSENSPVPSVWLIVLHWRGIDVTRACLSSLNGLTYKNYRTLLVDNGSTDNDGEVLGKEFPQVEVLRLADNLGFSGGSNRGIAACLDRQADFIWLLNNDTTVQPESLELLVAEAMQQPKAALLGAAIVESQGDGAQQIVASAGKIDFARAKTSVVKSAPVSQAVSCEWLHGANLLMRSTAIRQIGMFDDRYYLYFEDTELCHRARQAGWLCIFVPQARITHIGNASTIGKHRHWRSYYYIRNRALFFNSYVHGLAAFPARFSMLSHLVRHALVLPFRGQNGRDQLRAELLGYRDHLLNKYGKATCLEWCEN